MNEDRNNTATEVKPSRRITEVLAELNEFFRPLRDTGHTVRFEISIHDCSPSQAGEVLRTWNVGDARFVSSLTTQWLEVQLIDGGQLTLFVRP